MMSSTAITPIREASRTLVREWGFLRPTLADTALSPAAAHCLFEIGENAVQTVPDLRHALAIEEPELGRALRDLVSAGDIEARAQHAPLNGGDHQQREQRETAVFVLTDKGRQTLQTINMIAANQVQAALEACAPAAVNTIVDGMAIYAAALQALRLQPQSMSTATIATTSSHASVKIVPGYQPGILARSLEMHTAYYSRHYGWGITFERTLGAGLADLLGRLDKPVNEAWAAVQSTACGAERIVGTIFIDGEDLGHPPGKVAHLRAFIVDDDTRGTGAGRRLLTAAMDFVRAAGFDEVQLWTMRPLVAARRLYEAAGFVEVSEELRLEFGVETWVMHYRWTRPESIQARSRITTTEGGGSDEA